MRTKIFILSFMLSFSYLLAAQAQEKAYRKEKMNVMGTSYSGFSTQILFSEYKSKKYLGAYLKERGKVSEKRNFIEIKEMPWKQRDDQTKVYALVNGDSTQSRIWIGYSANANEELIQAIEGEMQDLPFLMNKYNLQFQVKEAETAATFLSKELKNTQRDGERLNQRLDQNARDKIKLEQALVQNAEEKIQIEQDIVHNSEAQEDKAQALEEIKKQLELLKDRLGRL